MAECTAAGWGFVDSKASVTYLYVCVALIVPAGKSREEVKATLKSERAKMPRRRLTHRRRTSRCALRLVSHTTHP